MRINIYDSASWAGVLVICKTISDKGKKAWLVGGSIRDSLLGLDASDYDIATDARPDQIMRWFTKVIPTGIKHGTVTVVDDTGVSYEVTTFRADGKYEDGRRPDRIEFSDSIEDDLSRRDLTVNAIAYDPIADRFCDPHGGAADILLRRLRTVGNPDSRFSEDGLRCLRTCRFAATLGFSIEEETRQAIVRNVETYRKVSVERVVAEWRKAFKARKPSIAFRHMAETGLLGATVPEFIPSYGMTQNKYHAYDIFAHTLAVIDSTPKDELVQFGALFHDVAKAYTVGTHTVTGQRTFYNHEEEGAELTKTIMTRLKFPTAEIENVSTLVRHHLLPRDDISNAGLRRWVRKVGAENVGRLLDLAQADLEGKGPAEIRIPDNFVINFRSRVKRLGEIAPIVSKTSQLPVNGSDVMEIGKIKPGAEVGRRLQTLLEHVTDYPEHNTREKLLELLTDWG